MVLDGRNTLFLDGLRGSVGRWPRKAKTKWGSDAEAFSLGVSAALSLYSVFSAVQAAELLGALRVLEAAGKTTHNFVDQLGLLKSLSGLCGTRIESESQYFCQSI